MDWKIQSSNIGFAQIFNFGGKLKTLEELEVLRLFEEDEKSLEEDLNKIATYFQEQLEEP